MPLIGSRKAAPRSEFTGANDTRLEDDFGFSKPVRAAHFLSVGVYIGTGNGVTFEPSKALILLTP
jgi:hypothetical protein